MWIGCTGTAPSPCGTATRDFETFLVWGRPAYLWALLPYMHCTDRRFPMYRSVRGTERIVNGRSVQFGMHYIAHLASSLLRQLPLRVNCTARPVEKEWPTHHTEPDRRAVERTASSRFALVVEAKGPCYSIDAYRHCPAEWASLCTH